MKYHAKSTIEKLRLHIRSSLAASSLLLGLPLLCCSLWWAENIWKPVIWRLRLCAKALFINVNIGNVAIFWLSLFYQVTPIFFHVFGNKTTTTFLPQKTSLSTAKIAPEKQGLSSFLLHYPFHDLALENCLKYVEYVEYAKRTEIHSM